MTAIEWLEEFMNNGKQKSEGIISLAFAQAKEMEKEQLCYFYVKGAEAEINNPYVTNIEFYNKHFKNTNK